MIYKNDNIHVYNKILTEPESEYTVAPVQPVEPVEPAPEEGCRPVLCRMYCANGWAIDPQTGCEMCQCSKYYKPISFQQQMILKTTRLHGAGLNRGGPPTQMMRGNFRGGLNSEVDTFATRLTVQPSPIYKSNMGKNKMTTSIS